jgi:hypothetical protein
MPRPTRHASAVPRPFPVRGALRPFTPSTALLRVLLFTAVLLSCLVAAPARPLPLLALPASATLHATLGFFIWVAFVAFVLAIVAAMMRRGTRARVAPARLQDAVSPFDVTAAEFRGNEHERYNSPLNQDRHREHAAQRRAVETAIEHSIRLADDQRRKRERREVAAEERHRVEQGDIDYGDQITGMNAETRDVQRFDIDFCAETEMPSRSSSRTTLSLPMSGDDSVRTCLTTSLLPSTRYRRRTWST